jgi:CHASE3 domain sensor protein
MRNVTLSADESLIDEVREHALRENTTLNEQFRLWLEEYARKRRAQNFRNVVQELQSKVDTGGRKFTREEMNER